jgi:Tfp pilus assembly protein PilE
MRKKGRRGFWLGEIVVALGLISVVSLTVIGLFSYLAVTTQTRSEKAAADLLANTLMENAVIEGPNGWGVGQTNLFVEVPVEIESGDAKAAEQMMYQVIPEVIEQSALGTLFRVRVRVSWVEPPGPNNVERGKGFTERTRTVYIDDWPPPAAAPSP